ncbi:MAG TPA: hypothetical protein VF338_01595, partial [Leptolinea sp.]
MFKNTRTMFFAVGAMTVVASLALAACAPAASRVVPATAMPAASSLYSQPTKAVVPAKPEVPVTGASV